jgi:hypothetical protein
MNIRNYDAVYQSRSSFKQIKPFMPSDIFTMLLCGPRNCGKTNLLMNILLEPCIYFDELYVYAKNLHQEKYQFLMKKFEEIAESNSIKNPAHFSNDKIIPVTQLPNVHDLQRVVVFDDYICDKNQNAIVDYFIQGRHKNCSVIYLSQSYFKTDKDIRINCSHHCIFNLLLKREIDNVLQDHNISKEVYDAATSGKHNFLYIDHMRNKVLKNFDELSDQLVGTTLLQE